MSAQNDIHRALAKRADGVGRSVDITAGELASDLRLPSASVNKTLYNLARHRKVDLIRGPNGRDIVGVRILEEPGPTRRSTRLPRRQDRVRQPQPIRIAPDEPRRAVRQLLTPHLDAYAAAKTRFEDVTKDFGDLVEAHFNENPYAEEGLAIKARLELVEGRYAALRPALDRAEADLRALRRARDGRIAQAVGENGGSQE